MSYKLLSYQAEREARAGALIADSVYDVAKLTKDGAHATVLGVLASWPKASRLLAQASRTIESGKSRAKGMPLRRLKLLAP